MHTMWQAALNDMTLDWDDETACMSDELKSILMANYAASCMLTVERIEKKKTTKPHAQWANDHAC